MNDELTFFPLQASTLAERVDTLFWFFMGVCGTIGVLVFITTAILAARYRQKAGRHQEIKGNTTIIELAWTIPPLIIVMVLFVWGAKLYVEAYTPPETAMEVFVTGKQWMWKIQHPNGRREINELHVPIGQKVKLTMTSEDVIHSFYVPAFRVKKDVLPGQYTTMWFEATRVGEYHLFCAEYCGTNHSRMIGTVHVMEAVDYHDWLSGGSPVLSMEERGQELFQRHSCNNCHHAGSGARGPDLAGLVGKRVRLAGGGEVVADAAYIRESILRPREKVVAGYEPVMPTFQGLIDEEGVTQLIAYVRSLQISPPGIDRDPPARQEVSP